MRVSVAITEKSDLFSGSVLQTFYWARKEIKWGRASIVKIYDVRPEQKECQIKFEVTKDGVRQIINGRSITLSKIKKIIKKGSYV